MGLDFRPLRCRQRSQNCIGRKCGTIEAKGSRHIGLQLFLYVALPLPHHGEPPQMGLNVLVQGLWARIEQHACPEGFCGGGPGSPRLVFHAKLEEAFCVGLIDIFVGLQPSRNEFGVADFFLG